MDKVMILGQVKLFEGVDPKYIKGIADIATEKTFAAGDYLMKQGENGIGLFIIIKGKVKIEKTDSAGKVVEVAENGPGDIMGEMAVLDGSPRTANVRASEDTICLVLASWEFNAFMRAHPELALEILPIVIKRFRETNDALTGIRL